MEVELVIFSTFAVVWLSFLLFKDAFMVFGPGIIWKGVPPGLASESVGFLNSIYRLGVMPVIAGSYVIYKNLFVREDRNMYLLIAFTFSFFTLLALGLIPVESGLLYFSVVLTISFAPFYKLIGDYLSKTKFTRYRIPSGFLFLVMFVFTSLIPSWSYAFSNAAESFSQAEMDAYLWLKKTPGDSVILTLPEHGHLVTAISKRRNVIDENYPLGRDVLRRIQDVKQIYSTPFETEAIRLMTKYDVDYLVVTPADSPEYLNERCFSKVYEETIEIYSLDCTLEEV